MAQHLGDRQERLRDRDVAPHLACDVIRGLRPGLQQPPHLARAPLGHAKALVDERGVVAHRGAMAAQDEAQGHLPGLAQGGHVLHQGVRAIRRGGRCRRARVPEGAGDERVGGDPRQQVVAGDEDLARLVPEDRVRRAVPGAVQGGERPVAQGELAAFAQRHRDVTGGAEGAEGGADRAQGGGQLGGDAVAAHHRHRELVVGAGAGAEVLQVGAQDVERRHLGARAPGDDLQQAEVVHVLMGDDDQPEILDAVPELGQCLLELVQGFPAVGPRVDQGQRIVLEQVAVDASHQKRRGHRHQVDARGAGLGERLLGLVGRGLAVGLVRAHERIRPSTSSRLASMSSTETSDSRHRRSSGSVLDARTLKCQSS